uniref:Uncharacterized protein n=1 Tax=Labrus bergylta TaxID=56723 RepID=A0A3Q3EPQ3_9LABR
VVEMWSCIFKRLHSKILSGRLTHEPNNKQFAQKQEEIFFCNHLHHVYSPDHVPHEQEEGIFSSGAKRYITHHNVGISVQELDAFLQTPEAALQTAQQKLGELILVVQILNSCMIPKQEKKEGRKRSGQGHLSHSCDEVGTPEEEEDVVELQADQVLVVNSFSSVEGKKALGVRALIFHGTGGEVLSRDTGYIEMPGHSYLKRCVTLNSIIIC